MVLHNAKADKEAKVQMPGARVGLEHSEKKKLLIATIGDSLTSEIIYNWN